MKTTNRNEVVNAWQVFFKDEPLVVMSFKPARIGVFTKEGCIR